MKLFPQLALVSAIAISGNAMAMQALDDTALSAATGQDGITIAIALPGDDLVIDSVIVRDQDGRTGNGLAGAAGAIQLGTIGDLTDALSIETNDPITVRIDADGNAGEPVLNINVALPSQFDITTGDIFVAVGGAIGSGIANATRAKVLDSMTVKIGGAQLNIQLGNEAQGAMIVASGSITDGLTISDLGINDANSGGGIFIDNVRVRTAGSANLTLNAQINATAGGLAITTTGNNDVILEGVRLGENNTAARLGDIELIGIQSSGTVLTISGH